MRSSHIVFDLSLLTGTLVLACACSSNFDETGGRAVPASAQPSTQGAVPATAEPPAQPTTPAETTPPPAENETPPAQQPAQQPASSQDPAQEPPAQEPAAEDPPAEDSAAQDPAAQDPAAQDPAAQDPAAQDPAGQGTAPEDPAAQDPAAQDPAAQDPAAQDPAAQDPAAQDPAAQDPAAQDPAGQDTDSAPNYDDTECVDYCDQFMPLCTSDRWGHYTDMDDCMTQCADIPRGNSFGGNTLRCRISHLPNVENDPAAADAGGNFHCDHAFAVSTLCVDE